MATTSRWSRSASPTSAGTTYVLMGTPKPRGALRRLTEPALPFRLLGAAARGRSADRRRPDPAPEGASHDHRSDRDRGDRWLAVALAVAVHHFGPRLRRPRCVPATSAGGSCSRSSPARCRHARSTPRCDWRAPRTRRSSRCSWRRVPLHLPLDAPLPRQSTWRCRCQEAIEQRADRFGVPVDSRIERGRTYRHALRQTIANERFDRIVIAAAADGSPGFDADDVAWLLDNGPGEIVVLRPERGGRASAPRAAPRRAVGRPRPRRAAHVAPRRRAAGAGLALVSGGCGTASSR